ncbi:hypothetical protein [Salinarchaeum laminariae]|uniref:hypothetical protein n=1 Tax=Salinarchaeum laminariae TaxID=869888 RepID=UPI0020C0942B|nr:hypothetical protein [Salinarchaeum laminariae]
MTSVPQLRQFVYALLVTATAFGIWATWFQSADGIWIMLGAIAAFTLLALLDGVVVGRVVAD